MLVFIIDVLFLCLGVLFPNQEPPLHQQVVEKLATYSYNHPQEKVYLHTDKSFYVPGSDIWFKAYLMIGPYQVPDTLTGVLYVELINQDEELISRRILHMRRGLGWGDFHLPATIEPGPYILKAYTRYMQNYDPAFQYRKAIHILPQGEEDQPRKKSKASNTEEELPVRIQFFPEGGQLAQGLPNFVALKANDSQGKGLDVAGRILDDGGNPVTTFETRKFGLGLFSFQPESGKKYHAVVDFGGGQYMFDLPESMSAGYAMHINKTSDKLYIQVRNNMGVPMMGAFVIGQFRGYPFITIQGKKGSDQLLSVISTRELPSGILQFTFFDSLGVPQCERLVYNENENERMAVEISSDKKVYGKREKATFEIHCEDLEGNILLTNMSLGITNTTAVKKDKSEGNIRSYFHLESDLKGHIEQPGYYFNPENEDRLAMLDILMLTHGWRRFVWKEVLEDTPVDFKYPMEVAFNIEGNLVDFYNRSKPRTGTVRLFIYEGEFYYNEIDTDDNGFFEFLGIDIYDSTKVVMQAWHEKEKDGKGKKSKPPERKNDLAFRMLNRPYEEVIPSYWPPLSDTTTDYSEYLDLSAFILQIDSSYEGRTIVMDELVIEDQKLAGDDPFKRPTRLHKEPNRRIVMDSLGTSEQALYLFDLVRKYFPGVQISGFPPGVNINLRGARSISGGSQPLILLDGQRVDADFMYYFPPTEIAFIDLLNSNRAGIYGFDAGNGVIAFFTRTEPISYEEEGRMGMYNFTHPGYNRAREFYSPNYDVPEDSHAKPDYRRVLFWDPSLTTDEYGNVNFSFFTSDEAAEYRVELEGMTYKGIPVTHEYYFSVE